MKALFVSLFGGNFITLGLKEYQRTIFIFNCLYLQHERERKEIDPIPRRTSGQVDCHPAHRQHPPAVGAAFCLFLPQITVNQF